MVNKLKEIFLELEDDKKRSVNIGDKIIAHAFKNKFEYGVFIEYDGKVQVDEKFNSIRLYTASVKDENVLLLSCKETESMSVFIHMAYDFIVFSNREIILKNPFLWFEKWKNAIGNYKKDLMVYDIIGELKSYICLCEKYKDVIWSSMHLGTHDLEAGGAAYEVKTTVNKTINQISISSANQLVPDDDNPLYILYVKVEKSENGYSIDDLVEEMKHKGIFDIGMEDYLEQKGYNIGKKERQEKYIVRNIFKYAVDENFPKITSNKFVGGKLPSGIVSISYIVDLSNLEFEVVL